MQHRRHIDSWVPSEPAFAQALVSLGEDATRARSSHHVRINDNRDFDDVIASMLKVESHFFKAGEDDLELYTTLHTEVHDDVGFPRFSALLVLGADKGHSVSVWAPDDLNTTPEPLARMSLAYGHIVLLDISRPHALDISDSLYEHLKKLSGDRLLPEIQDRHLSVFAHADFDCDVPANELPSRHEAERQLLGKLMPLLQARMAAENLHAADLKPW